jgi:hypothetical protein
MLNVRNFWDRDILHTKKKTVQANGKVSDEEFLNEEDNDYKVSLFDLPVTRVIAAHSQAPDIVPVTSQLPP